MCRVYSVNLVYFRCVLRHREHLRSTIGSARNVFLLAALKTAPRRTIRYGTVRYRTVLYCTVQYGTVLYRTETVKRTNGTVRYGNVPVRYRTVQGFPNKEPKVIWPRSVY